MPAASASSSSPSASKKKTATKKASASKSTAKKAAPKKASGKKAAAKKNKATTSTASKAEKTATKKSPAKSAPAKTNAAKKAPAAKKASTPKLPKFLTDKKWLKAQREALTEERLKYTHSAEALAAEAASLMADREPGDVQFDEESGEGDTLAVERDRDLALSAKAREKVDEIDAALARLDAGTYGMCISGDDIIPKERLEALPMAAKCVTHQTAMF